MVQVLSKYKSHIWWVGSAVVVVPLVIFTSSTDSHMHLVPVISYYGTSSLWTILTRALKV
jgi:hypothetical protein